MRLHAPDRDRRVYIEQMHFRRFSPTASNSNDMRHGALGAGRSINGQ
jgi:hypothetical protein